jgi:hypothetical protein
VAVSVSDWIASKNVEAENSRNGHFLAGSDHCTQTGSGGTG